MSSVDEVTGAPSQMGQALSAGLDVIDLNQTVTFTAYRRVVLPADGFVFWVKADMLSPSALPNTTALNRFTPNQARVQVAPAETFVAQGSLHQTTVNKQGEDDSGATNRMVFTSKSQVEHLNDINPDVLYMARVGELRFTFSTSNMRYQQAGLWHYSGDAVYPAFMSQVIEYPEQLNSLDIVVSNSLPIWLTFNQAFPVYPSYLVPDNVRPPYAAVQIGDDSTHAMTSGATHDRNGSRWQLVRDTVRVTTYGVRNYAILDWLDSITSYTLANPDVMGVMNTPVVRDAKRGQVEISALAQKKVITFEVNYYQARIRELSRQLITSAFLDEFIVPADVTATLIPH